jgi:hypothetical protein
MTHGYKVLVRKLLGKERPCGVLMGVLEKICGRVQTGHVADCSECNNEPSCLMKVREFCDYLSNCWLLRNTVFHGVSC